jgi:hypothetical protein
LGIPKNQLRSIFLLVFNGLMPKAHHLGVKSAFHLGIPPEFRCVFGGFQAVMTIRPHLAQNLRNHPQGAEKPQPSL